MSEGASIYIAAGADGITENDAMDEEKLTDGNQLQIRYPASIYLTVKASD